jgi:peptide/nickel transport system substrate-binding protein
VEAVDDTTVVFHFSRVYPYQIMDANVGSIVPEHILKDIPRSEITSAEFNTKPVGNGPFIMKSWRSQEQIEFVRNPNYYEPNKPYLDRIVVRIVPDRTTLLTQLKTGKIDFLEQVPPKEFQDMKQDFEMGESDIKPYEFIGRSYDFIAWNTIDGDAYNPEVHNSQASLEDIPNPFFANREVRRAMTLAIDRELIREAIGYGMLIPMNGTVSPILWAHDPSVETLPYDPDEARRILQEQGWIDADGDGILEKDGRDFRFIMKTNTGNERREQATTLIQDMLKQVGIAMEIRMEEGVTFFSNMVNKDFDAALLGWSIGLKVDFTQILHSNSRLDKYNFTTYGNPEFDVLNDEAKMMMDRERAKAVWRDAQEILIQDQPYTWLYYLKSGHGLHKRFKGVTMDERGAWINPYEWWVPAAERKYWMPSS